MNKMKRILLSLMLCMFMIGLVSSAFTSLGTFEIDKNITIRQLCGDCTFNNITSIIYPNGTEALGETSMVVDGVEYTREFNKTNVVGEYFVNGFGNPSGTNTVWAYTFDITSTGRPTPDGVPNLLIGLVVVIFLSSFFFLLLAMKVEEPGPKLFFLMLAFLALLFSIFLGVNVAQDSNVSASVDSTLGALSVAIGAIVFVVFAWLIIRQTIAALDMYKVKKGIAIGQSGGYGIGGNAKGFGFNAGDPFSK